MKQEPRLPLGYIPAGSTNDFAGSLGLSKNMVEAARELCRASILPVIWGILTGEPLYILRRSVCLRMFLMRQIRV